MREGKSLNGVCGAKETDSKQRNKGCKMSCLLWLQSVNGALTCCMLAGSCQPHLDMTGIAHAKRAEYNTDYIEDRGVEKNFESHHIYIREAEFAP